MDLAAKNGWGRGRRRWVAGALLPRWRSAAESPEMAVLAFQGSKSSGLGSGRIYASCVIHPWPLLGPGWSVAEGAPATAGQRGGGSPARVLWATPGLRATAKGAKGLGWPEGAYRGPKTAGVAARGGRRRVPAAWSGRSSRTGRSGASQGVWRHGATLGGTAKRFQGSEGTGGRRR